MIRFLFKGLLRDHHRSLFPMIIVTLGVMTSILGYCFLQGVMDEALRSNAKLESGHLKVMTRAYAEQSTQVPNDLAILGVGEVMSRLESDFPGLEWAPRIRFGGLLDLPDSLGETRSQGPVLGMGLDLLAPSSREMERLRLEEALIRGRLPKMPGEVLISEEFARRLEARPGEAATLISATSYGSMAVQNFTIVGTIRFGITALDRNTIIADLADIQYALNMEDGAGEVLGFFGNMVYDQPAAERTAGRFNAGVNDPDDEFSLTMVTLLDQGGLGEYMDMIKGRVGLVLFGFFFVMSLVLWNAGLMSGIRRYGEMGVRLAIGESKGHVYTTQLGESVLIGLAGSVVGTVLGLGLSYYLQEVGWDISGMMEGSNMLMANIMRAKITTTSYYIGLLPGLMATLTGTAISGIRIFKRRTAQLFKELET